MNVSFEIAERATEDNSIKPINIDLGDDAAEYLLYQLDGPGIACLENALNPEFLEKLRNDIDKLLDERGHRYFSIIQPGKVLGGPFIQMAQKSGLVELMSRLARIGHSDQAVDGFELYNVLRIIAGDEARKASFEFHYDATVITCVMPLYIPDGPPDEAGDLIALPNLRGYRGSSLLNIIEKVFMQNPLAFRLYKAIFSSGKRNVYKLKPGNLYFFWGYRTFHANLPCRPGAKRATLLFHIGNPHAGDRLTELVLNIRRKREERRLAKK